MRSSRYWALVWGGAALAFILVATLNSGGYRYGVGDQAFYIPALQRHLDPGSFPRDRILIDDQDRLTVFTRVAAGIARATGSALPPLFLAAYVGALLLLGGAGLGIASELGLSRWGLVALAAALTLRHRVGLTGVNTLEGYAHPRMLAFGVGLAAVLAFLRRRPWWAMGLVAAAFVVHPTTALWFAVWLGVALLVVDARLRRGLLAAAAVAGAAAVWVIGAGPLRPQLVRMDAEWLGVLSSKDYLFATDWPLDMWLVALLYVSAVGCVFMVRRTTGRLHARETGLAIGALALVLVFCATLPLVSHRLALAVQFQVSRVFWMLDFLGIVYAVWAVVDGPSRVPRNARRAIGRPAAIALLLVCAACGRGAYIMWIEHPARPVVDVGFARNDWQDAMEWLATTPPTAHVLADPGHAWRYGTSVRVSALRDVYQEEVKDTAMAIYSRRVALRVVERIRALGDFNDLTPSSALALAQRFDLDYLVTETPLDLPEAYRNARFRVYRLKR